MKSIPAGLMSQVVTSYDKTKTSLMGRAYQKTINSVPVIGPPLTKAIDVATDTSSVGVIVPADLWLTPNGRLFIINTPTAILTTVLMYTFDMNTGAAVYQGKISFSLPTTAITLTGFRVDDSNTSNIKIFVTTRATTLINGGLFLVNGVTLSDFTQTGTFIYDALASASVTPKAVFKLENPAFSGTTNNITQAAGLSVFGNKAYVHNGVAVTHQYHVFDYSFEPTFPAALTCAVTLGSPTFTLVNHGLVAGDVVVLTSSNVPGSGFGQVTPTTVQTTLVNYYYVQSGGTLTANTFVLATTVGAGAGISWGNGAGNVTVARAWGQSLNNFSVATGNLTALSGVLLLTNSEQHCVPQTPSGQQITGQDCVFFATSTNLYLGKLSELTSGLTTWPSLYSSNVLGSGSDITTPLPVYACYSTECDEALFISNTAVTIAKQLISGAIRQTFGYLLNDYIEGNNLPTLPFSLLAPSALRTQAGWLLQCASTVGQRVVLVMDNRSSATYDYSYITAPVIQVGTPTAVLNAISTLEQLVQNTNIVVLSIRSAATAGDSIFNSSTGGWQVIGTSTDLSSVAINNYIQIKIAFRIRSMPLNTPAQVSELLIDVTQANEISDNWVGSKDDTSASGESPAHSGFELYQAYATSVPKLTFSAYDNSGNLVATANTTDNPGSFDYSSNSGGSWTALLGHGPIPNTAFTTRLRYNWTTPPGVSVTVSIK